jgi:hypothetical protein
MARKTVGYVKLEWTCPRCDTKNPGPQKFCNGCGAPQPEDVEFEQPAQEKLIEDAEEIALAKAGPDVHCPYCSARNRGDAKFCGACGGNLAEAVERESGRVLGAHRPDAAEPVNCPACDTVNPASALVCSNCGASLAGARDEEPSARPEPALPTGSARGSRGVIFGVIAACVVISAILYFVFGRTEDLVGVVEDVSWTRTIPILAMGEVEGEDWRDDIRSDAVIESCRLEFHHSQDSPTSNSEEVCGTPYTIDDGSGFGEVVQDCVYEVYEEMCSYTAMDWIVIDEVIATGTNLQPYWPQVNLMSDQQEGEGTETYEIEFIADDESYTYTPSDQSEFIQFNEGSSWIIHVNMLDTVVSVEPE